MAPVDIPSGASPRQEHHKIIFLDVDGVLHSVHERHRPCRKPCMDCLRTIVQESGAGICLSSNWRLDSWGIDQVNSD